MERLKLLELENPKLERPRAQRDLEDHLMREVNRDGPTGTRAQARLLSQRGLSQRRARGVLNVPRSTEAWLR